MAVPRITKEDLKQRLEAADAFVKPLIIDVRLKYPYEHSTVRLPGAVRVAPTGEGSSMLPREREIVAYDSDPDELVSARVAADLIRRGYKACALKGGIADWLGANYPVEAREATSRVAAPPSKD